MRHIAVFVAAYELLFMAFGGAQMNPKDPNTQPTEPTEREDDRNDSTQRHTGTMNPGQRPDQDTEDEMRRERGRQAPAQSGDDQSRRDPND
jgi:hypothetical protein